MMELLPHLARGAAVTVEIFVLAAMLAAALALPLALARSSYRRAVRYPAVAWVEFWRGSSALVQLFWLFYVLPLFGLSLTPVVTAVVGLGLNAAAYGSEIVRGALGSVASGQRDAARSLGLRPWLALRHVVLPQALAQMLPPWGNLMVELLKSTALVSLITLTDLTFAGQEMITTTGRTTSVWLFVLVIYYGLSLPVGWGAQALERAAAGAWRKPA